jgi:arylsulfatase A-like enzyme
MIPLLLAAQASVLVIVLDDVGEYDLEHVRTPHIDALEARSVSFPRAWTTSSMCSPSRTAMTGLYGHRVGIGRIVKKDEPNDLALGTDTLARRLDDAGYATCLVGKWHLSSGLNYDLDSAPGEFGFDAWRAMATHNLGATLASVGGDFFRWGRVDDGAYSVETTYATTAQVDAALSWWNATDGPKFLWLAFSAAHEPFHVPPPHLTGELAPTDDRGKFEASIVAMDREIGRLLASIEDEPVVFLWSDNGTPANAVGAGQDPSKVKMSLYEGGVATPLFVRVPGVEPKVSRRIVSTVDLYRTVLDLARQPAPANDSCSFADVLGGTATTPPRTWAFSERFGPNFASGTAPKYKSRSRQVTDGEWKLLVEESKGVETVRRLFHLPTDPTESFPVRNPAKEAELQALLDTVG